ncbi:general odorant-binding protein 56d-like [Scaptodrosophila lebanonensis]|uniref:General odorant-binding protein 56d-like n=1 Tax=Drosophila lebanonensis TaxID=7225 RepID=A0A6J2UJZ5_DROLE|nr:general odorant-binding protein 56d-like [Scaptodrosophila lebanonensis]
MEKLWSNFFMVILFINSFVISSERLTVICDHTSQHIGSSDATTAQINPTRMKLIIAVLFVALASAHDLKLSEEQKQKAHEHAAECVKQEGITKEQAMALRKGDFTDTDPKVKCFANCFLTKAGFIQDGEVKPDVVLAKLGPIEGEATVKEVQASCDSLKGENACDTAYQLFQCYYKHKSQL